MQGINAVKEPNFVLPSPMAAASSKPARVQFNESIPWLLNQSAVRPRKIRVVSTDSKSSPNGLDVPVRLACFPSTLSKVEYLGRDSQRWVILAPANGTDEHPDTYGEAIAQPGWTLRLNACPSALLSSSSEELMTPTGPTRSGTYISMRITLPTMNKNPNRVTIFGASHSGRNSTNAFHWTPSTSAVNRKT